MSVKSLVFALGAASRPQMGRKHAIFNTMRDSKSLNPGFGDTSPCGLYGAARAFLRFGDAFSGLNAVYDKILNDISDAPLSLRYIAFQAQFWAPTRS
jgi:hypothetical protein